MKQQANTWASVEQDLCRHMASLGHHEEKEIVQIYEEIRAQVSMHFLYRYYISIIWLCFFVWV